MRTATNVMMLEKVCFGFIDPDREVFPPRGTPLDDFQKMCAWYQEKFPAAHVIRTEEEAKRMLQVHEDVHLLTLAA